MTRAAPNIQHEWRAQEADHAFLRHALPPDAYFTAIDHGNLKRGRGGKSGIIAGRKRKERGVKAGIPDWLIVWRGITLWIERKVDADLSYEQELTRDALRLNGHYWAMARSMIEVEAACREAGIPLRATAGEIGGRIDAAKERKAAKPRAAARKPKPQLRYSATGRRAARFQAVMP